MKYTIKTFGVAREIMGGRDVMVDTQGNTVGDLKRHLLETYPSLVDLRSLFVAVNLKYVDDDVVLSESDEIALIPPVSGG